MWTYLFETEGGLGGAIWCMLDETFLLPQDLEGFNDWWGILDKNVIPATFNHPVVGYGEWGIVDVWRRKKPEFWGTKKAYSPTKIYAKTISDFTVGKELNIPVHNRFDHTNFSELKINWSYGEKSGELSNMDLAPHQKGQLVFPANNWNADKKLHMQFYQYDTLLVDEYHIQLGDKEVKLPELSKGSLAAVEAEKKVSITGKAFTLDINKETGLLENLRVNNEVIFQSGPHIHLRLPGKNVQYSTIQMEDYARDWKLKKLDYSINDGIALVLIEGAYDQVSANFSILFDEQGVFSIDYQIDGMPSDKYIQEAGIKFITGDNFEKLAWNRDSYFTAYPSDDLGRPIGLVDLTQIPAMSYRQKPQHSWEMDAQGFYYFGLDEKLPYTNVVRSLKENIYSFALNTAGSNLEVLSPGTQACRFDKIDGKNTLIINDLWDYTSLLWGNYYKKILSEGERHNGKVVYSLGINN
jgi:hypothetical protein